MATTHFGSDAGIGTLSSSFFGTTTANANVANRNIVVNALIAKAVGSNINVNSANSIKAEIGGFNPNGTMLPDGTAAGQFGLTLLSRIPSLNSAATVSVATKAACAATLGSAAVSLK